ncbi:hypothetical protein Tco_0654542 [Tanacetum coccineum]|uniref:Uncharacterized protein n=1 Tax=Tanacetum coccineum TaxID=301880 RepID=A0ABQ4X3H8_9ASTR
MASLDRRLNPFYAIKECSSYGNLYTKDCGCSKGSHEDKILVPVPDSSQRPLKIEIFCLNCGDPVHGLYCRQCALIRKGTLTNVFQDFQDTSKSSDDDTNFVNQELFVVKQGPGDVTDDSYREIGYVDASPPDAEIVSSEAVEIVIPKVRGIDDDILLTIKDDILREKLLNVNLLIANIEALKDNLIIYRCFDTSLPPHLLTFSWRRLTPLIILYPNLKLFALIWKRFSYVAVLTCSDYSLRILKLFYSESNFYHEEFADELAHIISPPEYDHFCFKIEPELGNLTMDVVGDIFPIREPRVHVPNGLPTHPILNLDFIILSEPLFAYIVWIFLPFLTYPVYPPYLLSCGNEDTIHLHLSFFYTGCISSEWNFHEM